MNLSKANKVKFQGWAFHPSKKIAHEPLYIGYPISQSRGASIIWKVIVLRFPLNPNRTEFKTPVVFESGEYTNVKQAWKEAGEECT